MVVTAAVVVVVQKKEPASNDERGDFGEVSCEGCRLASTAHNPVAWLLPSLIKTSSSSGFYFFLYFSLVLAIMAFLAFTTTALNRLGVNSKLSRAS